MNSDIYLSVFSDPSRQDELVRLLCALCRIPAPSGHEEKRAAFIRDWLQRECGLTAYTDKASNVLLPLGPASRGVYTELSLFLAHTDTVFPDLEPMPVRLENDCIFSPGVGDNTACVAILMIYLKYRKRELLSCPGPLLFAFNSCEEGLGNLKGVRQILDSFGFDLKEAVSFDGGVPGICNHAVGSLRYRITLTAEGGHSYHDFGRENAIAAMSDLIMRLYRLEVPKEGRNTYNAGTISGGTSVNTIAPSCSCLFEYRSDLRESLLFMDAFFHRTLTEFLAEHPAVHPELQLVGERPCSHGVDAEAQAALTSRVSESIRRVTGLSAAVGAASTDCNLPLSLGIPSVCFGGLMGDGVHTRGEYVEKNKLIREAAIIEDFLDHSIT